LQEWFPLFCEFQWKRSVFHEEFHKMDHVGRLWRCNSGNRRGRPCQAIDGPAGRGTPPAAQQAIKPAATIDSQAAATDAAEVQPVQLSNDTTGGPVGVHSVVAGDGTGVTVASPAGAGDTPGASYGIVKGPEGETADQAAARARALNARRANKGQ